MAGYLEAGYSAVKVTVGRDDPREDLARLRAVRKLLGPSGLLMADANQRSPGETISRSRLLEEVELYWLEEPVNADDIEGHARAKAGMRVPLATGRPCSPRAPARTWSKATRPTSSRPTSAA